MQHHKYEIKQQVQRKIIHNLKGESKTNRISKMKIEREQKNQYEKNNGDVIT